MIPIEDALHSFTATATAIARLLFSHQFIIDFLFFSPALGVTMADKTKLHTVDLL